MENPFHIYLVTDRATGIPEAVVSAESGRLAIGHVAAQTFAVRVVEPDELGKLIGQGFRVQMARSIAVDIAGEAT